ncbi:hypothetical protein EV382_0981 [Micromonospora violae]|uniref:Transposase IS116/IS110/IS902 family protein n=1 Tax=Micromonospora violae TaxID=1278207 RepID=A0A4Q7UC84_9ACTN|nr:hypothetical protein EV382_0981 [Micromonospora violae]
MAWSTVCLERARRQLHIMATVQLRNPTEGRAYFDRKNASGETSMEVMRALKRRLSDIVYQCMTDDATAAMAAGPGGQRGTATGSSASTPTITALCQRLLVSLTCDRGPARLRSRRPGCGSHLACAARASPQGGERLKRGLLGSK